MVYPLWKAVWQFLRRLNFVLTSNPDMMLIDTYPADLKIHIHIKSCV